MKKRNIYKDIVWIAIFCMLLSKGIGWGKAYAKEQKTYGFWIQTEKDLTADVIEEFRKFSGICSFRPSDTADVTISLGSYTLQTKLEGLDLSVNSLKWMRLLGLEESGAAEEGEKRAVFSMGRTPALFFGKDAFFSFADKSGYPPLKSQVEKWLEQYGTLELIVTDESGRERKAKICGILSQPEDKICMDISQMKEIFYKSSHTAGGFMKIQGYKNMKKARGLLENAGFVTQDAL